MTSARRLLLAALAAGPLVAAAYAAASGPPVTDPGSASGPDSGSASPGSEPLAPIPAAGPPADAYPLTVEHKFGSTEIPAAPERVVSLGYTEQDAIVAFGIAPIAVRYAFGPEDDVYFPWVDAAASTVIDAVDPVILPRAEINFEQIAELEPDLIMAVTAGLDEQQYETLSGIAPVVVQPEGYVDFGTPWQVQTQVTGAVFGQPERAAELVADVEATIDAAAAAHPEFAELTLALSGPSYDGQYPFHASDDTRTRIFVDLGFVVPEELDAIAGDEFYGALSREQASMLDTDVLVWQSGSDAERAEIEADPILAALPVVAEGRALFIEGSDYDALQFSSALSLPYLIDSFVPKIAAVTE